MNLPVYLVKKACKQFNIPYISEKILYKIRKEKNLKSNVEAFFYHVWMEAVDGITRVSAEWETLLMWLQVNSSDENGYNCYYAMLDDEDYRLYKAFKDKAFAIVEEKYRPYLEFLDFHLMNAHIERKAAV